MSRRKFFGTKSKLPPIHEDGTPELSTKDSIQGVGSDPWFGEESTMVGSKSHGGGKRNYAGGHYTGGMVIDLCKDTHDGRVVVVEDKARGITVAGAAERDLDMMTADLVLDLVGGIEQPHPLPANLGDLTTLSSHLDLYVYAPSPEILPIHWPDMKVPQLAVGFWPALWAAIAPDTRVVATCFGSHGRTGTALTALYLCANPDQDLGKAVAWVREVHCKKAVESQRQMDYLQDLYSAIKL
jgi:hypothetical protein